MNLFMKIQSIFCRKRFFTTLKWIFSNAWTKFWTFHSLLACLNLAELIKTFSRLLFYFNQRQLQGQSRFELFVFRFSLFFRNKVKVMQFENQVSRLRDSRQFINAAIIELALFAWWIEPSLYEQMDTNCGRHRRRRAAFLNFSFL